MSDKTIVLIETVKQYPVLYDTSDVNYKSNKIKNQIWEEIAKKIQEKDGETARAKWKNLRDSYAKHIRFNKPKSDEAVKYIKRYKTWPWVKQMSFLQPYLEITARNKKSTDQYCTTFQVTSTPPQTALTQYQDTSTQEQTSLNQQINADFDETDLIFLGYSKIIKKMPMRLKAEVKFKIAKIIMEAEIKHIDDTNAYVNNIMGQDPLSPTGRDLSQDYYILSSLKCEEDSNDNKLKHKKISNI